MGRWATIAVANVIACAIVIACGLDRSSEVGGSGTGTSPPPLLPDGAPANPDGGIGSEGGVDIDAGGGGDGGSDGAVPPGPCPAECNGGCSPLDGACIFQVTSPRTQTINCPQGRNCIIQCSGTEVCLMVINCPAGKKCTQMCSGQEACKQEAILNANGASSVCLVCSGAGGKTGCDSNSCNGTCSKVCGASGCNGCNNCGTVAGCL